MQPIQPIQPLWNLSSLCSFPVEIYQRLILSRFFCLASRALGQGDKWIAPFQLLHQLQEPHTFHFGFVGFPFNPHLKKTSIYSNCWLAASFFSWSILLFIQMTQKKSVSQRAATSKTHNDEHGTSSPFLRGAVVPSQALYHFIGDDADLVKSQNLKGILSTWQFFVTFLGWLSDPLNS